MKKLKIILLIFFSIFISFFSQIRLTNKYFTEDITNLKNNGIEYKDTITFQKKYNFGRIEILYTVEILLEFFDLNNNLKLEKVEVFINNNNIGTIEINKNLKDLEIAEERNMGQKKIFQKYYSLEKGMLKLLGNNNKKYKIGEGELKDYCLDIYIKDLDTNEIYIVKRDIDILFEKKGIDFYLYFPF